LPQRFDATKQLQAAGNLKEQQGRCFDTDKRREFQGPLRQFVQSLCFPVRASFFKTKCRQKRERGIDRYAGPDTGRPGLRIRQQDLANALLFFEHGSRFVSIAPCF
jgi:hypothetical protein